MRSRIRFPTQFGLGRVDLRDDNVDHAVEQSLLAVDVLVERHGNDVQLLRDLPHADALDTVPVGQGNGRLQDPLPAQRHPGS